MASRHQPVKQLRELLQEKQEPFVLELYLMEKGYLRKRFNPVAIFSCSHGNSRKPLKRAVSCDLKPQCSKVLRAVYNRVFSLNERLRIKSRNRRDGNVDVAENKDRNKQEIITELDRFSSASSSTVFDSCGVSDVEETSTSQPKEQISIEGERDRKEYQEESRQLNPVSVLEEVASHRSSPLHNNGTRILSGIKAKKCSNTCAPFQNEVTENSILSASLWKVLVQSATDKPTITGVSEIQEIAQSNPSSRYLKSLQQTKQLLFDCVREIVETQERKVKQRAYLASEEFGRLVGERIKCLGGQCGKESNLAQLLELDFGDSAQEWISYEPHRRRIGFEIGDAILEEIRIEIVMDFIDFSPMTKY